MPKPPKPKPGPKPKPKPAPEEPPEITQAELARFRTLKARQKLLDNDVAELTRSLIDRVKRRATVERGKWLPQVNRQEARHFSLEVVAATIGTEEARAILATITPTVRESLSLIPDES